jgi:hypothetical protein
VLAVALITSGGYVGASYGILLNFDSPSQALTTVWLLALAFAITEYLDGSLDRRSLWVIGGLGVACTGGKASAAIVMIGAVGVSGDGIDQDDMISFLGLHNAGTRLGGFGNAPMAMRADQILIPLGNRQVRLRYIGCPFAPFLDTAEQNVCQGL